jgi:nitrite reductase (NADH) large subunit
MKHTKKVIVVGNGMVGYKFCEKLMERDVDQVYQITVFGEEPVEAYDRVHLSEYFSKTAEELSMAPRSWYDSHQIDLKVGERIIEIKRDEKVVVTRNGDSYGYDTLVLATGSAPFVPPVDGVDQDGIFVYRTFEDLDKIKAHAKKSKSCAVIGGGLLGLEAAKCAQDLGLQASVVEFAARLMPRQLDETGGTLLKKLIEDRDIEVMMNKSTKSFQKTDAGICLNFADESKHLVDMVIVSAGIRPRDELAKASSLVVGPRGGIQVNSSLKTSDENIYAIGECALYEGMIYGLVAPGYQMAEAVAEQLCGRERLFEGADMSTKLKLIGTDVASIGQIEAPEGAKELTLHDPIAGTYKKIVVDAKGEKLLGAVLVGSADEFGSLLQMYLNDMKLPENPMGLIAPQGGAAATSVLDLPDSAQICSCENVTKGDLCAKIEDGCADMASLKKCTKAGTGCGGCVPMVADILDETLKANGVEVKNEMCEHFKMSRVEMNEIVRLKGIRSFEELLEKHGEGGGCEVCKPAAASIFASTYNDKVLNQPQILDTNDAYLANMQKNGTYSVVPRVAAGEITPDKLIAIGQIAKEFDLYTKITGGQRIDLFGAHLDQLPVIWEKLIAAGFETGHAYAKSLRTVKSCVGETWCRYGVGDSTALAIKIEERYKGLRSPHKLKSAVSGCTRECAEAQSKDFGIIATEKGWNLYLCGNGGIKPRHADLFASDLDEETLIRYIDRFLMYYVKTADKLMRTSTWMDKLPGGLEHLKDVVINDSLNCVDELEKQMQSIVDSYHCEWKDVVEDPEKRKRFRHFVNSEERDPLVEFGRDRDQITPITEPKQISTLVGV